MADRRSRIYLPPLRVDVTVRDGVPSIVPLARLAGVVRTAALAARAPEPSSVGLLLTDDAELGDLNREHMGHRGPTDVLSFPLLPEGAFAKRGSHPSTPAFVVPPRVRVSLGDVVVSVERAIAQAHEGGGGHDSRTTWSARDELLLLVTHGTLHLCGWDHAEPMERAAMRLLERRLLRQG